MATAGTTPEAAANTGKGTELSTFKTYLAGGGARANQFRIHMNWPVGISGTTAAHITGDATTALKYLCSATSLPGMTLGEVTVPFRGRNLYMAGDRTFEAWTITVLNDTDFKIRNAYETWINYINAMTDNSGTDAPAAYTATAHVYQLNRAGGRIKTYSFQGLWPTTISNIDVSAETNDAIETFDVTLRYNYWEATATDGETVASTTS